MQELVEAAIELAHGAGDILRRAFGERPGKPGHKSTVIDLVTSADHESEAYVLDGIARRFPDHAVLSEESGAGRSEGPFRWIVDPLDGTVNMAHRIPHFCVLIAVQQRRDGGELETVIGVTHDPLRRETFVATRGQGATLNGEPVRVSRAPRLIEAVGATGFRYDRALREDDNHREFCRMNLVTQGVRRAGSAGLDLAYVACGRFDLFWEYGLNSWDMAAGSLLVTEAGGRVSDVAGGPVDLGRGEIVATNGLLHERTLAALASARDVPANSRDGLVDFLPPELAERMGH